MPRLHAVVRPALCSGFVLAWCSPLALRAQAADALSKGTATTTSATDSARAAARTTLLGTVRVQGRADNLLGVAQSASQGRVSRADLRTRPMSREGEILENVPGMILTQHSGDGKANQMFSGSGKGLRCWGLGGRVHRGTLAPGMALAPTNRRILAVLAACVRLTRTTSRREDQQT